MNTNEARDESVTRVNIKYLTVVSVHSHPDDEDDNAEMDNVGRSGDALKCLE